MIPTKVCGLRQAWRPIVLGTLLCLCFLEPVRVAYGQADNVGQMITSLKDASPDVRRGAAHDLGDSKDPRAVEPLIAALGDTDHGVRANAAHALGLIGDSRAVDPLIGTLKDADFELREEAAHALGLIGDSRAVDPLIGALKDSNSDIRRDAAYALGYIRDPRTVEPLVAALKDPDSGVKRGAAEALGKTKDPRAVEPLIATLKDSDTSVKLGAAKALGEIGDRRATKALAASQQADTQGTAIAKGDATQVGQPPAILKGESGGRFFLSGGFGLPSAELQTIDDKLPEDFGIKSKDCYPAKRGQPKRCIFGMKFKDVALSPGAHTLAVSFFQTRANGGYSTSDPVEVPFVVESGHTYRLSCQTDYSRGKWVPVLIDVTRH
jgi:hypothetical protein